MSQLPVGLCRLITRPLRWVPPRMHSSALALALNQVLQQSSSQGELQFLCGKTLSIEVMDLHIRFFVRRGEQGFSPAHGKAEADVSFSGDSTALLALATRREDADTLFFQRRLRIQGDTATGLHLKNYLDAMEELPLPESLRQVFERFAGLYIARCALPIEDALKQG